MQESHRPATRSSGQSASTKDYASEEDQRWAPSGTGRRRNAAAPEEAVPFTMTADMGRMMSGTQSLGPVSMPAYPPQSANAQYSPMPFAYPPMAPMAAPMYPGAPMMPGYNYMMAPGGMNYPAMPPPSMTAGLNSAPGTFLFQRNSPLFVTLSGASDENEESLSGCLTALLFSDPILASFHGYDRHLPCQHTAGRVSSRKSSPCYHACGHQLNVRDLG